MSPMEHRPQIGGCKYIQVDEWTEQFPYMSFHLIFVISADICENLVYIAKLGVGGTLVCKIDRVQLPI